MIEAFSIIILFTGIALAFIGFIYTEERKLAIIGVIMMIMSIMAFTYVIEDHNDTIEDFCKNYIQNNKNTYYCLNNNQAKEFTCNFENEKCYWINNKGVEIE